MNIRGAFRGLRPVIVFVCRHWLALAIPLVGLVYGVGDSRGWWDWFSGRSEINRAIQRLASQDGFPVAFIYAEDHDFARIERFISERTQNPEVRRRFKSGQRPSMITRAGGGERIIPVPKEWPKFIAVPAESPILYSYDAKPPNQIGSDIEWAGTLEEARSWIERWRSSERMWISIVLTAALSIALVIHEKRGDGRAG
jgi:hypothetical protein